MRKEQPPQGSSEDRAERWWEIKSQENSKRASNCCCYPSSLNVSKTGLACAKKELIQET
jgi:hypothetical protein